MEKITENFLQPRKKDRFSLIISGMGYSGKTSLMRYFHQFCRDYEPLARQYAVEYLEYDSAESNPHVIGDLSAKIEKLKTHKRKGRILQIDNYDDLYRTIGKADLKQFYRQCEKYDILMVLTGKIPADLMKRQYSHFLPRHFNEIVLEGIENPVKLITAMLKEVGFPSFRISTRVKRKVANYAGGMPYFCKKIVLEMLKLWLSNSKEVLEIKDVKEAALSVANAEEEYYLDHIIPQYDSKDENRRDKVQFQDIMSVISQHKGAVSKKMVERELVRDVNEEKRREKEKIFQQKLQQMELLGLVREEQGNLVGVPLLFHFQGTEGGI